MKRRKKKLEVPQQNILVQFIAFSVIALVIVLVMLAISSSFTRETQPIIAVIGIIIIAMCLTFLFARFSAAQTLNN